MNQDFSAGLGWKPAPYDCKLVRRHGFMFRMESEFWASLDEICGLERITRQDFVAHARKEHPKAPISHAVRMEILGYFRLQGEQAEPSANLNQAASGLHAAQGRKPRILLVDDDPDVLAVLTAGLLAKGFEVTAACGADEALRSLADHNDYSIVVSDFAMVGLNGVQLVSQIRQHRPGIPALIISGYITSATSDAASMGIECLAKPVRQSELVNKIKTMIEIDKNTKVLESMVKEDSRMM